VNGDQTSRTEHHCRGDRLFRRHNGGNIADRLPPSEPSTVDRQKGGIEWSEIPSNLPPVPVAHRVATMDDSPITD
jgi:hypothetical protein